jgi:hypothetical protein
LSRNSDTWKPANSMGSNKVFVVAGGWIMCIVKSKGPTIYAGLTPCFIVFQFVIISFYAFFWHFALCVLEHLNLSDIRQKVHNEIYDLHCQNFLQITENWSTCNLCLMQFNTLYLSLLGVCCNISCVMINEFNFFWGHYVFTMQILN